MLNIVKIRLYPDKDQSTALGNAFGCVRFFWNNSLAETNRLYKETGKGLSNFGINNRLPDLKEEFPFLKEVYSQILQATGLNLSRAFINFFQGRSKFPKFKNKDSKQSIHYPQNIRIDGQFLILPKIGKVEIVLHRSAEGVLKSATISKSNSGKYFASLLFDDGKDETIQYQEGKIAGIDLGIKNYAIVNNGEKTSKFDNPKYLGKYEKNLKRKQQKLSRKLKCSKQRLKAKKIVVTVHEKISNTREDFLHKLSRKLVDKNQVLVFENLAVRNMVKNHSMAKSISDCSWNKFINFCNYKMKRKGGKIVEIDRFFASSKTCNSCLYQLKELGLEVRNWQCPSCKTMHDRDENAAINIRAEGIRILSTLGTSVAASGGKVRPKRGRKKSSEAFPNEA